VKSIDQLTFWRIQLFTAEASAPRNSAAAWNGRARLKHGAVTVIDPKKPFELRRH
jgi:hypothetical protein